MKYFGTDGIRGVVGKTLTPSTIKKVANAVVKVLKKQNKDVLLVGNDSRESSDYILSVMESIMLSHGIRVENLGVCSSPSLAYIAKKYNYPLAMMLSASHNSSEYNGIKFFNSAGEKATDGYENMLEFYMDKKPNFKKLNFEKRINVEHLKADYLAHLKTQKKAKLPCIFDCANGGASAFVKAVFPHEKIINANPLGTNINKNAGCTNIEMLCKQCINERKIGFALDGDGDRLFMVSKTGEVITGDKILYILSNFYQKSGDTLVGTVYTNMGLEKSISKRKVSLERAKVGDKNVYQMMQKKSSILGGEDSGHIIIKTHSNTGDGLLNAILLMNILFTTKCEIEDLLADYSEYFQAHKNIKISNKFVLNSVLKEYIETKEEKGCRIVIRESGTEPVLRIMVENKDKTTAEKCLNEIIKIIKNIVC